MPRHRDQLTEIVDQCFTDETHRTVVIATVSPLAQDTETSIDTLRWARLLNGQRWIQTEAGAFTAGGEEDVIDLGEFDITARARELRARNKVGAKDSRQHKSEVRT